MSLGEPNGNNFAPDLPHREPDEVQCEIRSCPRPAESVLLLRGQFRTRCVTHAMELRRQGATLTELDPGFDHPPGQPPAPVPNIPEVPVCKIADCTSPAKTRGFCMLHWGRGLRVLHITGAAHVSDEDMHAAILRWTPAPHGPTPKSPEVTNADTPAPATPAPSPEPSAELLPDQPAPSAAVGDVWTELILACEHSPWHSSLVPLMQERRALGIARYGVPLQRANGRDHIVDASQELLDAAVYCWAAEAHGVARETLDALLRLRMLPVERDETNRQHVSQRDVLARKLYESEAELAEMHRCAARDHGEIQNLKDALDVERERLELARNALRLDEYFLPGEVGEDVAPRIIERLAAIKRWADQVGRNHEDLLKTLSKPQPLTEEDLERRFAALVESRKLRAIALGEVSDVS